MFGFKRKAYWIYWRENGNKRCKCSACKTSYGCMDTPYCPNCGRKMHVKLADDKLDALSVKKLAKNSVGLLNEINYLPITGIPDKKEVLYYKPD